MRRSKRILNLANFSINDGLTVLYTGYSSSINISDTLILVVARIAQVQSYGCMKSNTSLH